MSSAELAGSAGPPVTSLPIPAKVPETVEQLTTVDVKVTNGAQNAEKMEVAKASEIKVVESEFTPTQSAPVESVKPAPEPAKADVNGKESVSTTDEAKSAETAVEPAVKEPAKSEEKVSAEPVPKLETPKPASTEPEEKPLSAPSSPVPPLRPPIGPPRPKTANVAPVLPPKQKVKSSHGSTETSPVPPRTMTPPLPAVTSVTISQPANLLPPLVSVTPPSPQPVEKNLLSTKPCAEVKQPDQAAVAEPEIVSKPEDTVGPVAESAKETKTKTAEPEPVTTKIDEPVASEPAKTKGADKTSKAKAAAKPSKAPAEPAKISAEPAKAPADPASTKAASESAKVAHEPAKAKVEHESSKAKAAHESAKTKAAHEPAKTKAAHEPANVSADPVKNESVTPPVAETPVVTVSPRARQGKSSMNPAPAVKQPRKRPAPRQKSPPVIQEVESKRSRKTVAQFQSPIPEMTQIMKKIQNKETGVTKEKKTKEPNPAIFFRGEYLAVRNDEQGFFLCQAHQNIYRASKKIKIQWLSENNDKSKQGDVYVKEFYDNIEFETILSSIELDIVKRDEFLLTQSEKDRIIKILNRAVAKADGNLSPTEISITEDNPEGLDVSIYKDEDQLKKIERKRRMEAKKEAQGKSKKAKSDDVTAGGETSNSSGSEKGKKTPAKKEPAKAAATPANKKGGKTSAKPTAKAKTPTKATPAAKVTPAAKATPAAKVTPAAKTTPAAKPATTGRRGRASTTTPNTETAITVEAEPQEPSAEPTKPARGRAARKSVSKKDSFDFEDEDEEEAEVMPMPKKRSSIIPKVDGIADEKIVDKIVAAPAKKKAEPADKKAPSEKKQSTTEAKNGQTETASKRGRKKAATAAVETEKSLETTAVAPVESVKDETKAVIAIATASATETAADSKPEKAVESKKEKPVEVKEVKADSTVKAVEVVAALSVDSKVDEPSQQSPTADSSEPKRRGRSRK